MHYTIKQWGVSPSNVDGAVTARVPVYLSKDNRYFQDKYQGIPLKGYTKLIENILFHKNIKIRLNTDFKDINSNKFDRIFYTGSIDEYFDYKYGVLEYRSVRFETELLETDNYQGNAVVNYTEREVPYTRIIEHKHFEFGKQPVTVISREYPSEWKPGEESYYPVNDAKNEEIADKYRKLTEEEKNVIFGGRLGEYRYYDMDKVIGAALKAVEKEQIS